MPSARRWILMGAGLLAAVCAAGALWDALPKEEQGVPLPVAFNMESIGQRMNEPEEITKLYSSTHYKALTNEQRHQVDRNKAQAYNQMVHDWVDEYFEASDAEREAVLDRHLDEFTAQMSRHGKPGEAKEQQRPKSRKRPMNKLSRQERKAKSESADPDRMGRIVTYKMALIRRAQVRGIELPGVSPK